MWDKQAFKSTETQSSVATTPLQSEDNFFPAA